MTANRLKRYANEIRNDIRYGNRRWHARRDMPQLSDADRKIVDALAGC